MTTQTYRRVDLSEFEGHTLHFETDDGNENGVDILCKDSPYDGGTVATVWGTVCDDDSDKRIIDTDLWKVARLFRAAPDLAAELADARKQIETLREAGNKMHSALLAFGPTDDAVESEMDNLAAALSTTDPTGGAT